MSKPGASASALAADIFNQDGFFRGAVTTDEQRQPDLEPAEKPAPSNQTPFSAAIPSAAPEAFGDRLWTNAQPEAAKPSPEPVARSNARESAASAAAMNAAGPDDAQDATASAIPHPHGLGERAPGEAAPARSQPLRDLASTAAEVTKGNVNRAADLPSDVRSVSFRDSLEALLPRLFAQDRAALNTRVSVHAVEHGLRIVVKLGDLTQEERIRLRDRIAATLSRHGLVGREVTLNGDKDMASAKGND